MCQRTDGEEINAGFRIISSHTQAQSATGFESSSTSRDSHRLAGLRNGEVVQQNQICTSGEDFL